MNALSGKLAYWNLPPDRQRCGGNWRRRSRVEKYLKTDPGVPERLGVIDLSKPFEVQSFHLRRGPGRPATCRHSGSSSWSSLPRPGEAGWATSAGSTLLVDADTGMVRYQIDKRPPPRRRERVPPASSEPAAGGMPSPSPAVESGGSECSPSTRRWASPWRPPGSTRSSWRSPGNVTGPGKDLLAPGPVGEYLEVVDRDPASKAFYAPVDLDDPHLLAQCGLTPSESNPQFHQQMVYAVAMRTIRTFERALGRLALWSPAPAVAPKEPDGEWQEEQYVQRLRIYPHALREPNAYYSPDKKALLFGYFPAPARRRGRDDPADRVHLPVPRHHRSRDDPCPPRRHAPAVP